MFAKLFILTTTLAVVAFAAPSYTDNTCFNGSEVQCCDQLHEADSEAGAALLAGLINAPISNPTGQVGVTCTAVTALGAAGGTACSSQPVCCQQNNINNGIQVISVNCSPVNGGI